MATINLQSFATTVANQVSAIQTQCSALISFTTGSILRAVVNSNAAVAMWLQGLTLQVMALTRFATSFGSDADSWGLDWGHFRAAAAYSTGYVTFSRFTATTTAFIPLGTLVMTADRTQQFSVIADPTNPAYSDTMGGYTLPGGTSGLTVLCQSTTANAAANVNPGMISLLATGISGVDYVTNALAFTAGTNGESDADYKSRFPAYLQTLARGTPLAISSAIEATQSGAQCTVVENTTYGGASQPGYCTVIVDDGTGAPNATFLNNCTTLVNAYRAGGIQYGVFGPSIITVNVTYTLTTAGAGTAHANAITVSQAAVTTFINALPDGATLAWSQLYQVIYDSAPGVITDVTNLLVNGGTSDLVPAWVYDVYKAGSVVGT